MKKFVSYLGSQFAKISDSRSVRGSVDPGLNVHFQIEDGDLEDRTFQTIGF